MDKIDLQVGDIVQINPDKERWGGFFCVVTEPKTWGCQGYLLHHGAFDAVRINKTNLAYVRLKFEDIEFCGKAFWMCHEKDEEV
jgi:hypothetical protein